MALYQHVGPTQLHHNPPQSSVAMAQADVFAILGNKIVKNLKIFVEVDYLQITQEPLIRSLRVGRGPPGF